MADHPNEPFSLIISAQREIAHHREGLEMKARSALCQNVQKVMISAFFCDITDDSKHSNKTPKKKAPPDFEENQFNNISRKIKILIF